MRIDGDLLLAWMTHLGSGSWAGFRSAVAELAGEGDSASAIVKKLRIVLSELGHADFFVDGTTRWQVRAPALAGTSDGHGATLVGGRTPDLLDHVRQAAISEGVHVDSQLSSLGLRALRFQADQGQLGKLAEKAGVPYLHELDFRLASALPAVIGLAWAAARRSEPINWEPWSWDFSSSDWVAGRRPNTARRYVNRHGAMRHMLHFRRGGLRKLGPFLAIYAAAAHNGRRVASYDVRSRELRVPRRSPLPEAFSRAACIAGGLPSTGDGDRLIYGNVAPEIASIILARLGQPLSPFFQESPGVNS
ncbi:MAG: hypothetical protein H6739_06885 [Alphaproteobacteria bacterium]|nr:hypothetical protein [Alphaproteobacteria bacterium]